MKRMRLRRRVALGAQHTLAMFGATVLVPMISGFDVSVTLFCAGVSTLAFHLVTRGEVPVFLGSSFAFLPAYAAILSDSSILELAEKNGISPICYAAGAVAISGLAYVAMSSFLRFSAFKGMDKLFPPIVTGPVIILIGLTLIPSAAGNLAAGGNFISALPGMISMICAALVMLKSRKLSAFSILIGLLSGYIAALILGGVDFTRMGEARALGIPPIGDYSPLRFGKGIFAFNFPSIITCCLVAIVTMTEHVGDMAAISKICGRDFTDNPGLHKTLLGDGLGTCLAGLLGGPANTTYSENSSVIAMTKVSDPSVVRIAACFSILLSFSPKFTTLLQTIPVSVTGGMSLLLYAMISIIGFRTMVENKVDFSNPKNTIILAAILAIGLGFSSRPIVIGRLSVSGLAMATILGIVLNLVIKNKADEATSK